MRRIPLTLFVILMVATRLYSRNRIIADSAGLHFPGTSEEAVQSEAFSAKEAKDSI